jgi:hypothetical protein
MSSSSETARITIVPMFILCTSLQLLAAAHISERDQKEENRYAYKNQIKHGSLAP